MRKTAAALALAASIFIVAGCTTTPTAPPALDLPAGTGADPALERWWTAFNDPTLTALVDEALANNLDLRAAMTRIDLARAQVKLAQKDLYPGVDLGVGASRTKSSEVGSFPLFGAPATTQDFRVELSASYEVDLWSKFRTATRAAQDDLLASRYARETVRTVVAADVARTYFQLLAADAQLDLLSDSKTRNETVELQRDRYQGGVIGDYDLAQAEAERDRRSRRTSPLRSARSRNSSRRSRSCSAARRAKSSSPRSRVMSRSCASSACRRFPPDCPPTCCCAGPTFAMSKRSWRREIAASTSRAPTTFRRCR